MQKTPAFFFLFYVIAYNSSTWTRELGVGRSGTRTSAGSRATSLWWQFQPILVKVALRMSSNSSKIGRWRKLPPGVKGTANIHPSVHCSRSAWWDSSPRRTLTQASSPINAPSMWASDRGQVLALNFEKALLRWARAVCDSSPVRSMICIDLCAGSRANLHSRTRR